MNEPQTPEQWQLAVDAAEGVLAVKLARLLGLIEGGSSEDAVRCADIIHRAAEMGITPGPNAVRDFVGEIAESEDRERIYRVVKTAIEMSGNPDLSQIVPFLARGEQP